jgi:hypothetical protein
MATPATATAAELAPLLGVSLRTVRRRMPQIEYDDKTVLHFEGTGARASIYYVDEVKRSWHLASRHKIKKRPHRVVELLTPEDLVRVARLSENSSVNQVHEWFLSRGHDVSRATVHRWIAGLKR